jgi:hypothetical protein
MTGVPSVPGKGGGAASANGAGGGVVTIASGDGAARSSVCASSGRTLVRAATETIGMAIVAETELLTRDAAPGLRPPAYGTNALSHPNILGGHPSTLVSVFRGSAPFRTKAFDQLV